MLYWDPDANPPFGDCRGSPPSTLHVDPLKVGEFASKALLLLALVIIITILTIINKIFG